MKENYRTLKRGANWVLVCREQPSEYEKSVVGLATSSSKVHELVRDRIMREQVEVMYVLALDGSNRVVHLAEVARGGLHGLSIHAADIFRPVIVCGATGFALVHNHPSGDPHPSPEDVQVTQTVIKAAKILGLSFKDHVIVGSWDRYFSFLDSTLLLEEDP